MEMFALNFKIFNMIYFCNQENYYFKSYESSICKSCRVGKNKILQKIIQNLDISLIFKIKIHQTVFKLALPRLR